MTVIVCCSWLLAAWPVAAQDSPVAEARAHYERADFRQALGALSRVPDGALDPVARAEVLELRATVLFALRADGWEEALVELARIAPDHVLPPQLHPRIRCRWRLSVAARLAPAETLLAHARAAYSVADFERTLALLRDLPPHATRAQLVERLVLEALALFALQDSSGARSTLARLARLSPDHTFGAHVPPAFREAWEDAVESRSPSHAGEPG